MFPLTRILTLAAAGALVALTAASAGAEDRQPPPTTAAQADVNLPQIEDCHLQRRAISRRACQARLWHEMHIDIAENN
jgi:hypothetical protein